jgi:hypothetical protein
MVEATADSVLGPGSRHKTTSQSSSFAAGADILEPSRMDSAGCPSYPLYRESQALADTGSQDIQGIGRLTSSMEKPAEAAEVEIRRELIAGRKPKI